MPPEAPLPQAVVAAEPRHSLTWVLPLLAALLAAWLGWQAWSQSGEVIVVTAAQGHGIEAGDTLRYRGITVGEIEDVRLASDLGGVHMDVRLHPSALALAREGSRFWVVRPHLSLEGVQGLETIVGARYLSVLPGEAGAAPRREFTALDEPPVAERIEPGGLTFVIEAPARFGLAAGAPLDHRGVRVGTLMDVSLASDAASVELAAYVRPEYTALVRENTLFWEAAGLEIDLGWVSGLNIELDSLRSLLVGGLTMATPEEPGPAVRSGHRFTLSLDVQDEWLEWRAAIPVGSSGGQLPERLPAPVRAELSWKEGRVFRSSETRIGWLLAIPGGLLGPADLLGPAEDARADTTRLSLGGGESIELGVAPARSERGLAVLAYEGAGLEPWPLRLVAPEAEAAGPVGDCLVIADPERPPTTLSGARLVPDGEGWRIDGGPQLDAGWHGAVLVERERGLLVGILLHEDGDLRVARPLPQWW